MRFRVSFPFPPLQGRKDHIHGAACIALVSVNILFPVVQGNDFPQLPPAIVGWVNIIGNVTRSGRPPDIGDFLLFSCECAMREFVRDFSRPRGDECFHLFDWLLLVDVECSHGLMCDRIKPIPIVIPPKIRGNAPLFLIGAQLFGVNIL